MHQSVNCGHGCHWVLEDFIPFGEHQITGDHHAAPILLAYPNAWIYQFSEEGMVRVKCEDTEHFQIIGNELAVLTVIICGGGGAAGWRVFWRGRLGPGRAVWVAGGARQGRRMRWMGWVRSAGRRRQVAQAQVHGRETGGGGWEPGRR